MRAIVAQVRLDDRLPHDFTRFGALKQHEKFRVKARVGDQLRQVRHGLKAARRIERRFLSGLRVQMPEAGGAQARERIVKARLSGRDVFPVVEISFNEQGRDFDAVICDFAAFNQIKNREQQERLMRRGRAARTVNAEEFYFV